MRNWWGAAKPKQTGVERPGSDLIQVEGVLLKDCRDTTVVRLAEAGCTPFEIASITGHCLKTVMTILRHYFVPTAAIADNAIAKLDQQNR